MSEPVAPIVNDLNAPFWEAAAEGRLLVPLCRDTGRCFWPPSPASPFTGGAVGWTPSPGGGSLRGLVVYRRGFQKAFEPNLPYGVGLVELDEGPRLQAYVAEPEAAESPRPGDRVALAFDSVAMGGPKVPVLRRAEGEGE
jgi:uncharacterized OB-fold protein